MEPLVVEVFTVQTTAGQQTDRQGVITDCLGRVHGRVRGQASLPLLNGHAGVVPGEREGKAAHLTVHCGGRVGASEFATIDLDEWQCSRVAAESDIPRELAVSERSSSVDINHTDGAQPFKSSLHGSAGKIVGQLISRITHERQLERPTQRGRRATMSADGLLLMDLRSCIQQRQVAEVRDEGDDPAMAVAEGQPLDVHSPNCAKRL